MVTDLNCIFDAAGELVGFHSETIDSDEPFIDLAARFASVPGTVVLLSGGDLDCSRFHILGALPWLTLRGRGRKMEFTVDGRNFPVDLDPFDALDRVLSAYQLQETSSSLTEPPHPIAAGLMGYLAYDLKDHLERLPKTSIDDLHLPHMYLCAPSVLVVRDRADRSTRLFIPDRRVAGRSSADGDLRRFYDIVATTPPAPTRFGGSPGGFRSNATRSGYLAAIKKIKKYIAAGDVYQVNMSQRFEMGFDGCAFSLFRHLYRHNPAPFFSYVNARDHRVVSTSPERYLSMEGRRVETRPIKGTRPRGKTPREDRRMAEELRESPKDDAELSMVVDLLRNDIGKVCETGSVRVREHKRLEAYENVYHLVSIVDGRLPPEVGAVDLIKAAFPGGSITGCPKIRAMEIIDELEPHRRHVYTGAVGYMSFHETMDLSIAIRTATVVNDKIFFSVGGGIVYDSDPEAEYEETLHKGKTLMAAFQGNQASTQSREFAWVNGVIRPATDIAVPLSDLGVQYGFGFFETLRVDSGTPRFLDEHIERFNDTWKQLFDAPLPDLTWEDVIEGVIAANSLADKVAAVKILVTAGTGGSAPCDRTLAVTAHPYVHRLDGKLDRGLRLVTYPEPRHSPLADYKTLNYLYYYLAGRWATEHEGDEALILNPDRTLSETNTGNLILITNKIALLPESPHVLTGVMERIVCRQLRKWGYTIDRKCLVPDDLFDADDVLITNSLMGTVPLLRLDGTPLSPPSDLWHQIDIAIGMTAAPSPKE